VLGGARGVQKGGRGGLFGPGEPFEGQEGVLEGCWGRFVGLLG